MSGYGGFMPHYPPLPASDSSVQSGHTKDIEILKRRSTRNRGAWFAQWESDGSYEGQGEILDWSAANFSTNHEGIFPTVDAPGLVDAFATGNLVPVIDYSYFQRDAPGWHTHWFLTLGLHYSSIRKGIHWIECQPDNIGSGSSTGFSAMQTQPFWLSTTTDVILSGGGTTREMRCFQNDRAQFGNLDGSQDAMVAQVVHYYRQGYTGYPDGNSQVLDFYRLHAYVIPNDADGVYATV